jgi:predicted RNase H-like HicB family nuclease
VKSFNAMVWQEEDWFIAQCLEVDVASQGETEDEALVNLQEALELYFESPRPARMPQRRTVETDQGLLTAIVPHHREVRVGTLRSILRQAGLSVEEFETL